MSTPSFYPNDPATPYVGPDLYTGAQSQAPMSGYAQVQVEEAIGSSQDTSRIQTYVHLLAGDVHSNQTLQGYAFSPLKEAPTSIDPVTGEGVQTRPLLHTYERWVRIKFTPPFNAIFGIRFWVSNYTQTPGWNVLWGTSSSYQTPVNTASAIATGVLPTTDSGPALPNCGGYRRLPGTGVQYSDWIVMQATADPATAGVGPVLGFTAEGTLIPITFNINWIED